MKYCNSAIKNMKDYKMGNKVKKVYRPCLGVGCRGEKKFWSFNGARLCLACAKAIEGHASYYQDRVIGASNKALRIC